MTVVLAFVDGLGHDMQEELPYLATLQRRSLRTELGYSVTCHASMYTGLAPREHGFWFLWQRAPQRSPFRWLRASRLDRLPDPPLVKAGLHKVTALTHRNSSFFGIQHPVFTPLRQWHQLAPSEERLWRERGYAAPHPTWFDLLRQRGARVRITGMRPSEARSASERIAALDADTGLDVDYLFFGDVDPRCHAHGKDAPQTRERIRLVDRTLEAHVRKYDGRGEKVEVLAWSDHGHAPIERRVPVFDHLRGAGVDLDRALLLVDANYARFWPASRDEESRIRRAMGAIGGGWFLGPEELQRHDVDFPDDRYGALIYYLDRGAVFDKGPVRVLGREFRNRDVSMHGYLPEHAESAGFVAASSPLAAQAHIRDIAPSVLALAGVPAQTMARRSLLARPTLHVEQRPPRRG